MPVDVLVGGKRGDEGKGRFVDFNAPEYDIIARGNGGSNAGHTFVPENGQKIATHQLPSGIIHEGKVNVIGGGVYFDPVRFQSEVGDLSSKGYEVNNRNLMISNMAHLVLPHHVVLDEARENSGKAQGSTVSGIAFVAQDKYLREGMRIEDALTLSKEQLVMHALERLMQAEEAITKGKNLSSELGKILVQTISARSLVLADEWASKIEDIKPFVGDTRDYLWENLADGRKVLAEGAQAFWLDINHGMYPFVTSSSTTSYGVLDGLGIPPKEVGKVMVAVKAVDSHVGGGPFVTEIDDPELSANIRGVAGDIDSERGATTGRDRRVGYLDLVQVTTAAKLNGATDILLSKLDHIPRYGDKVKLAKAYANGGVVRGTAPSSARQLEQAEPLYTELDTFNDNISHVREYDDLPAQAKNFVQHIEDFTQVPVTQIGVGPYRNQVITRTK